MSVVWTLDSEEAPSDGPLEVLLSPRDLLILPLQMGNKETSRTQQSDSHLLCHFPGAPVVFILSSVDIFFCYESKIIKSHKTPNIFTQ